VHRRASCRPAPPGSDQLEAKMSLSAITRYPLFRPAVGAALTAVCGLALWSMPLGDVWVNASYDYLFRFGSRKATNQVVLVLMDNEAYDRCGQKRGKPWDRALHAQLLNRLADDGCPLVVFDCFFGDLRDPVKDQALADALRRQKEVVLMAEPSVAALGKPVDNVRPLLPADVFLHAGRTSWGVAWLDPDLDGIVRRHWPFPAPGPFPSLAASAAESAGAKPGSEPQEQWLRYYGDRGSWTRLSYPFALGEPTNFFRDKFVFVGNDPHTSAPDAEEDKFRTPYTRWEGVASSGVEVQAAIFLNLVNGEWLRRAPGWVEGLILAGAGVLIGGGGAKLRLRLVLPGTVLCFLFVLISAVWCSHVFNYWFPWLVVAGGQIPCALAWACLGRKAAVRLPAAVTTVGCELPRSTSAILAQGRATPDLPETPDYEVFTPAFGEGAFGKVWLVRNAVGQWQALKAVYEANFGGNSKPYDTEFRGIQRYKPVSDRHPGLLRVDFVSRKKRAGYFYYVMELGDSLVPGWQDDPATYRPRDLASELERTGGRKLPLSECLRIGIALAEALDYLHRQGLTHRDIKPKNIIFVNGHPKLADVGLVAEIRPEDATRTIVGTPQYMPPPPEIPGTPEADIYGLGMVLYVISTGQDPRDFERISAWLAQQREPGPFERLGQVILKACQPAREQRYKSAAEMLTALVWAQGTAERNEPAERL
jgi:CHASE2 domain-containing sensor protein